MTKLVENLGYAVLNWDDIMKHKKAMWNFVVAGAIAILLLVVSWYIVKKFLGSSSHDLSNLQSCEGRNGHCLPSCSDNDMAYLNALGCGSGDYKDKKFCCIPQQT